MLLDFHILGGEGMGRWDSAVSHLYNCIFLPNAWCWYKKSIWDSLLKWLLDPNQSYSEWRVVKSGSAAFREMSWAMPKPILRDVLIVIHVGIHHFKSSPVFKGKNWFLLQAKSSYNRG